MNKNICPSFFEKLKMKERGTEKEYKEEERGGVGKSRKEKNTKKKKKWEKRELKKDKERKN